MFKRALTSAAAIAALLLTTTVAKADFIIDTFTSPNPATTYTLGNTAGSTYSSGPSVLAPGVTRVSLGRAASSDRTTSAARR